MDPLAAVLGIGVPVGVCFMTALVGGFWVVLRRIDALDRKMASVCQFLHDRMAYKPVGTNGG